VLARRAVLAAEIDDLQVQRGPALAGEHGLEIVLDLLDGARARQLPAPGEAMDVRVDRERGHVERLRHHHARGLVADAGQRLEQRQIVRDLAAVVPHEDPESISKALRRLLTDDALAGSMRGQAEREAERLAWPAIGQEYLRLAHRVLAEREAAA